MEELAPLEHILGVTFKKKGILFQSLIHRSYLNENPECQYPHNERLEFLGDAILEFVVTEHIYLNCTEDEGMMTNWRASIVNTRALARVAHILHLGEYIKLSKGESKDPSMKAREYILADAVEAVIGAIFLDQGSKKVKLFIEQFIIPPLKDIIAKKSYIDPKTKFQELSQEHLGVTPSYKVMEESGPDHDKHFVVGAYINADLIAEGRGGSKQEAQVDAATQALRVKGWK